MVQTIDFTAAQVSVLTDRLKAWSAGHPEPRKVVMAFSGGRELTPPQIAQAVASQNEDGRRILALLAQGLAHVTFEDILASYPA